MNKIENARRIIGEAHMELLDSIGDWGATVGAMTVAEDAVLGPWAEEWGELGFDMNDAVRFANELEGTY